MQIDIKRISVNGSPYLRVSCSYLDGAQSVEIFAPNDYLLYGGEVALALRALAEKISPENQLEDGCGIMIPLCNPAPKRSRGRPRKNV